MDGFYAFVFVFVLDPEECSRFKLDGVALLTSVTSFSTSRDPIRHDESNGEVSFCYLFCKGSGSA